MARKAVFAYTSGFTDAETTFFAENFDLVILSPQYDPQNILATAEAIKAKNPNVKILAYRPLFFIYTGNEDWSIVNANEAWFLHDANGNRIQDTGSFAWLLDPSNTGWRSHFVMWANANYLFSPAYDGIYADFAADEFPAYMTTSAPLQQADLDNWHVNTLGQLQFIKSGLLPDKLFIINWDSLSSLSSPYPNGRYEYIAYCDGMSVEGFVHPEWIDSSGQNADWYQKLDIDDLAYVSGLGKVAIALSGTSTVPASDAIINYCLASYFLAMNGNNSYFAFNNWNSPDGRRGYYPLMDTEIGSPVGAYQTVQPYVFTRNFTGGSVAVNLNVGANSGEIVQTVSNHKWVLQTNPAGIPFTVT